MDKQNIYGVKYEVDIDSLKTSTREAGQQIRQANAEFNEASSRLDNWATSTEGVSAKIKQLNTILDAEKSKLANSQKAYNDNIESLNKYEAEIADLKKKKQEAIEQYGAESAEVKELNKSIQALERTQSATVTATEKLKTSITNQQATVNRTEKSIKNYGDQLEELEEAQARAEKSGRTLEAELKDIRDASEKADDSVEELGNGFTVAKGAIANFIAQGLTNLIQGLGNAIEETREYRAELGKLEATAETMGASFNKAKENLKEVASITDDTGAGVEGLNNLLSAGFDGSQLDAITDQLLGASIKWKDTLKFEGLSDGLQETLATGKAIGPFAEMLERAGGSLEHFDAGLQKAIKSGNEQQYVLDYISKYGLKDVKNAYEENNQTLIDSAKATYEFNETMAEMSETVEPVLTSVKRGFTKMLKAIMDGADDVDLSGLTDTIEDVFDLVGSGTKFIIKNLDKIIPVVGGLTAAWITYKGAVLLANGAEKAGNVIKALTTTATVANTGAVTANTVATNGATVATKLLALAQKMTPWGAVAGLIAGVVTGLIAFANHTDKATKEAIKENEAITKSIEKQKELKQARTDAIAAGVAEHDYNARLADELKTITDENGKVKKGYEDRAGFIVNQLNEAYGTEIEMINGVIQEYDKQIAKIDEVIEKQRAKTIIEAGQEEYANAVKNQTKAYDELLALEEKYQSARAELERQTQNALARGFSEEQARTYAKTHLMDEADLKVLDSYNKKKQEVMNYTQTIADQEKLQELYANGSAEAIKQINNSVGESYKKNGQTVTLEAQKQLDIETKKYNDLMALYQKTGDDTYLKQAEASKKRIGELNKELEASKSTVETKTPGIVNAWDLMGAGAVGAIKNKNGQFKQAGRSNADNVKAGVNEKKDTLTTTTKGIAGDMVKGFNSKQDQFKTAGEDVKSGISKGMGDGGSLVSKIGGWASDMVDEFKRKFKIKSPSKVMEMLSGYIPEGAENGIEKKKKLAVNAMGSMAKNMVAKYNSGLKGFDILPDSELKGQIEGLKGKLKVAVTGEPSGNSGVVNNITFNQQNNSPKPLDSLQIYRDTQKQLKQLKQWRGVNV